MGPRLSSLQLFTPSPRVDPPPGVAEEGEGPCHFGTLQPWDPAGWSPEAGGCQQPLLPRRWRAWAPARLS